MVIYRFQNITIKINFENKLVSETYVRNYRRNWPTNSINFVQLENIMSLGYESERRLKDLIVAVGDGE